MARHVRNTGINVGLLLCNRTTLRFRDAHRMVENGRCTCCVAAHEAIFNDRLQQLEFYGCGCQTIARG